MARGEEDPNPNPRDPKTRLSESSDPVGVGTNGGASGDANIFSPRFKSAAAMAGWDEESLLMASLVVDDTPERELKHKRRSDSNFKTPPTNSSRRKRRAPRRSPISIPVAVLNLDDDEEPEKDEGAKEKAEPSIVVVNEEKEKGGDVKMDESSSSVACSSSNLPCLDKLRDELSCAICLEICFEPTTTPCGHSFCKKCLRSAADKCGKRCPKCRQLISNSRSCTVNTVLWNTIQLLFPQEVETRKAAGASSSREAERKIPIKASYNTRSVQSRRASSGVGVSSSSSREVIMRRRRVILSQDEDDDAALAVRFRIAEPEPEPRNAEQGGYANHRSVRSMRASSRDVRSSRRIPSQDEDAALALRMQREEFMEVFRGSHDQSSRSIALARANLRAMIARATAGHL